MPLAIHTLINKNLRFIKYLLVGGGAFVFEILTLYILKQSGTTDFIAVSISFWAGFLVAFVLQKVITFNNKSKQRKVLAVQLMAYSALVLFNYAFTLLVVAALSDTLNVYIIRTVVIAITTAWNYYLYRYMFR